MAPYDTARPSQPATDPVEPDSISHWIQRYVVHIQAIGYTAATQAHHARYLKDFFVWCGAHEIAQLDQVSGQVLEQYLLYLQNYRKRNGQPLNWVSKQNKVIPLRSLFRWLTRIRRLPINPAVDLTLGRAPERLPKEVFKPEEIKHLLTQPDVSTPDGIRDRAMLETLVSTGLRRAELGGLRVQDIKFALSRVIVNQGKGRKDRVVPIGRSALHWIERYLKEVRPFRANSNEEFLFLTPAGARLGNAYLSSLVGRYVRRAFPGRKGACHLFRHTMATLMLDGGADIRHVQEMLGHAQLSTTQIYTQVSIDKLQAVHGRTMPDDQVGINRETGTAGPAREEAIREAALRVDAATVRFRERAHRLIDELSARAWFDLLYLLSPGFAAENT